MRTASVFSCPNCGGDVPAKAAACPHCGSDENTGWSEQTYLDGLDLPEHDFIDTLKDQYGVDLEGGKWKPQMTAVAAILMITLFILFYVLRC